MLVEQYSTKIFRGDIILRLDAFINYALKVFSELEKISAVLECSFNRFAAARFAAFI